jgi:ArsR family transcriptional regulator, arsenate/arsenite/antimonite-responsive transcriptional repressor
MSRVFQVQTPGRFEVEDFAKQIQTWPRLSEDQVQNIAKALADPRRYEIIKRIKRISRSAQPLACESVRGCLEITAPTLSHHMKELEIAGLITVRRSGKFINYEFRRDVLESFLASLRREFM